MRLNKKYLSGAVFVTAVALFQNCSGSGDLSTSTSSVLRTGSSFASEPDTSGLRISSAPVISDGLQWMSGPSTGGSADVTNCFHYELRDKNFDPQKFAVKTPYTGSSPWTFSPFADPCEQQSKMTVDTERSTVYWHKDVPYRAYSGEIYKFDSNFIYLRNETWPEKSNGDYDFRADRFRIFAADNSPSSRRRGGNGKIHLPRKIEAGFTIENTFPLFICESYGELQQGTCGLQIDGYHDTLLIKLVDDFDVVYDGELAGFVADAEYRRFEQALVVEVFSGTPEKGESRERFFYGAKKINGAYRSYGLIRWDNSYRNRETGEFIPVARSVALKKIASTMNWSGFQQRADNDNSSVAPSMAKSSGVRILLDDGTHRTQACQSGMLNTGSLHFGANSAAFASSLYDADGSNTLNGGWIGFCRDPQKTDLLLTLPNGCPALNQRGSLFVSSASVATSLNQRALVSVTEDWVVLCAARAADTEAYLSLATTACEGGTSAAGSFIAYKDCYDGRGRRCPATGSPYFVLCSK